MVLPQDYISRLFALLQDAAQHREQIKAEAVNLHLTLVCLFL